MEEKKTPLKFESGELTTFASEVFLSTVAAADSIASGNPYGVAISAANILKNARGFIKLKSVMSDVLLMRNNKTLSDQTIKSEKAQENLIELMDALEKEMLTHEKFEVLRKIFLQGLINIQNKRDEVIAREFLVQARKLEPSEVLILGAIWNSGNSIQSHAPSEEEFLRKVEEKAQLPSEICQMYISKLGEKAFVKKFTNNLGWNCELTTFGRQFCSFVSEFERMEKAHLAREP